MENPTTVEWSSSSSEICEKGTVLSSGYVRINESSRVIEGVWGKRVDLMSVHQDDDLVMGNTKKIVILILLGVVITSIDNQN